MFIDITPLRISRDYRLLFFGQLISTFGSAIGFVVLPVQLYQLTTYRVLKPGGVIGIKEFDHGGDFMYPTNPAIEKYAECYLRMRRDNGHNPQTGREAGALLLAAGFNDLKCAAVYESFADPKRAKAFADVSAGLLAEGWGEAFTSRGWATAEEICEMRTAWDRFAAFPGAIFAAAWCEAVAWKA